MSDLGREACTPDDVPLNSSDILNARVIVRSSAEGRIILAW